MIVVRVELHSAITSRVSTLGVAHIANDCTGNQKVGNYTVAIYKKGVTPQPLQSAGLWRRDRVIGFPRTSLGVWDLLYRALTNVVGERNRAVRNAGPEDASALRTEVERLRRLEKGTRSMIRALDSLPERSGDLGALRDALERLVEGDDVRSAPIPQQPCP